MVNKYTIAVDFGHGNNTFPPSKGVNKNGKGYAEHSFNSKLGEALNKRLIDIGFKTVVYQKPNAPDVPLKKRTDYYNAQKVDLVFSIHANANGDPNVNGRCAFYWGTSPESKRLAEIVVKNIKKAGYTTHGNGLHAGSKGSWTNLHINRETKMPAVLVENGFMTGNKDFDLIFGSKQDRYVKDLAKAHADSIAEYFGVKAKPSAPSKPSAGGNLYRVRKSWSDSKSQLGAFNSLNNAQSLASKKSGYGVYDSTGKLVSGPPAKPSKPKKKSIAQMAKEVNAGDHGNGHANRRKSLGISSAEYVKVRAEVNRLAGVKPSKPKPSKPSLKVGARVTVKKSAKKYATGESIPARVKGKKYTIQQVGKGRVLLKEILSWVNNGDIS